MLSILMCKMDREKYRKAKKQVKFRLSDEEFNLINADAMRKEMSISAYSKNVIIKDALKNPDIEGNTIGKEVRLLRKSEAKAEITKHNSAMYLIRNCQKTIYNLGVASLFNMKKLNFPMLSATIDKFVKFYETFTPEQKELLKEDIEALKQFKDKKFMREKFNSLEMLDFIKKDKK